MDSVKNCIVTTGTALVVACEVCRGNIYVSVGPTNMARIHEAIQDHKCEITTKGGKKIQLVGGDA